MLSVLILWHNENSIFFLQWSCCADAPVICAQTLTKKQIKYFFITDYVGLISFALLQVEDLKRLR